MQKTVSNSPSHPRAQMRLCKHGESGLLLNYYISNVSLFVRLIMVVLQSLKDKKLVTQKSDRIPFVVQVGSVCLHFRLFIQLRCVRAFYCLFSFGRSFLCRSFYLSFEMSKNIARVKAPLLLCFLNLKDVFLNKVEEGISTTLEVFLRLETKRHITSTQRASNKL